MSNLCAQPTAYAKAKNCKTCTYTNKHVPLPGKNLKKGGVSNFMISITVKENESIDKALKRFKKKLDKAGVLREYRSRTFYEKPSVKKKRELLRAVYRQRKMQSELEA